MPARAQGTKTSNRKKTRGQPDRTPLDSNITKRISGIPTTRHAKPLEASGTSDPTTRSPTTESEDVEPPFKKTKREIRSSVVDRREIGETSQTSTRSIGVAKTIGFELETGMDVRHEDGLKYHTVIFEDRRGQDDKYFSVTVETAEDRLVLEFQLAYSADRAVLAETYRRVELMRSALAETSNNGKQEVDFDAVVQAYQGKLASSPGKADTDGRMAGLQRNVTLPTEELGNKRLGFAPQMTIATPLSDVPRLLEALNRSPDLIRDERLRAAIAQVVGNPPADATGDAKGLIMLVESYLAALANVDALPYTRAGLPVMARTDFHSMYSTLDDDGRRSWDDYVNGKIKDLTVENARVIPQGYVVLIGDRELVDLGPKVEDWLRSISAPALVVLNSDVENIGKSLKSSLEIWEKEMRQDPKGVKVFENGLELVKRDKNLGPLLKAIESSDVDYWGGQDLAEAMHGVVRLFGNLGANEKLADIAIESALVFLSKDLMSRSVWVGNKSAAMGAMTVPQEGEQAGMAILELRQLGQQPDTTESWDAWLAEMTDQWMAAAPGARKDAKD